MAIKFERWRPPKTITRQEKALLKRCARVEKLFRLAREHRDELFDEAFQQELEQMYRRSGAGKPAVPPALDEVCAAAGIPVLLEPCVKKGLDGPWDDPAQKP